MYHLLISCYDCLCFSLLLKVQSCFGITGWFRNTKKWCNSVYNPTILRELHYNVQEASTNWSCPADNKDFRKWICSYQKREWLWIFTQVDILWMQYGIILQPYINLLVNSIVSKTFCSLLCRSWYTVYFILSPILGIQRSFWGVYPVTILHLVSQS